MATGNGGGNDREIGREKKAHHSMATFPNSIGHVVQFTGMVFIFSFSFNDF